MKIRLTPLQRNEFGSLVRILREQVHGLSLRQFADLTGYAAITLSNYETGKRAIGPEHAHTIAKHLGLDSAAMLRCWYAFACHDAEITKTDDGPALENLTPCSVTTATAIVVETLNTMLQPLYPRDLTISSRAMTEDDLDPTWALDPEPGLTQDQIDAIDALDAARIGHGVHLIDIKASRLPGTRNSLDFEMLTASLYVQPSALQPPTLDRTSAPVATPPGPSQAGHLAHADTTEPGSLSAKMALLSPSEVLQVKGYIDRILDQRQT